MLSPTGESGDVLNFDGHSLELTNLTDADLMELELSIAEDHTPPCEIDHFVKLAGDSSTIKQSLATISTLNPVAQEAMAKAVEYSVEQFALSSDLQHLAGFCQLLLTGEILDVVFRHVEPVGVLGPVRRLLDWCETSEQSFEDDHPIERYGQLVLFLQLVIARFKLWSNLAASIGSDTGFCAHWLRSASAVHSIASLDEDGRSAVHGWIGGLFGEGISDELINSTNPRVLLRVAPTICQQSLVACQLGVIDDETLREGLNYYLQPLLSFTLPGVIRWLVAEIGRTEQSKHREAMVAVVKMFTASASLPRSVLELVAADLARLGRLARQDKEKL